MMLPECVYTSTYLHTYVYVYICLYTHIPRMMLPECAYTHVHIYTSTYTTRPGAEEDASQAVYLSSIHPPSPFVRPAGRNHMANPSPLPPPYTARARGGGVGWRRRRGTSWRDEESWGCAKGGGWGGVDWGVQCAVELGMQSLWRWLL